MKNFIFKSTQADLQKIIQLIDVRLDIHGKNILYITHRVDKILRVITSLENNQNLQKQVDEYFTKDEENSFSETSPQTDNDEQ